MKKIMFVLSLLVFTAILFSCDKKEKDSAAADTGLKACESGTELSAGCADCPDAQTAEVAKVKDESSVESPLITFIELGSVNCIPCKKMQPVMKAIEEKYAGRVKVIFYDVWKPDQKKYAQEYKIRLIPTLVFLDKEGREIFRHEGFFPETEIKRLLEKQGLHSNTES